MGNSSPVRILLNIWVASAAAAVHALQQASPTKRQAVSSLPSTAETQPAADSDNMARNMQEDGNLHISAAGSGDFQHDLSTRALQQHSSIDEEQDTEAQPEHGTTDSGAGNSSNTNICSTLRGGFKTLAPDLYEFSTQVLTNNQSIHKASLQIAPPGGQSQLANVLDDPNAALTVLIPLQEEIEALIASTDLEDAAQREEAVAVLSSHVLMHPMTLQEFLDFDSEATEDRMYQNLLGDMMTVHSTGSVTVMFALNEEKASLVFERSIALGFPCAANSRIHRITKYMTPHRALGSPQKGAATVAIITTMVVATAAAVACGALAAWHFKLQRRRITSHYVNTAYACTPVKSGARDLKRNSSSSQNSIVFSMSPGWEASTPGAAGRKKCPLKTKTTTPTPGVSPATAYSKSSDQSVLRIWEAGGGFYGSATHRSIPPSFGHIASSSHARQQSSDAISSYYVPSLGEQQKSGLSDMHGLAEAVSTLGPTTCMSQGLVPPPGDKADAYEWKEYVAYQLDTLQGREVLEGYVLQEGLDARATGGQAVVQMAVHARGRHEVAIKFFVSCTAFQDEAAQYSNDASPLRSLLPRCLGIHDNADCSFVDGNGMPMPPCIVMEKGESLDRWMRRNHRKMDQFTCMQVLHHICECLMDLHAAGYAHRDVKPANVMWLPSQNRWTLIDFGCAAPLGTPAGKAFTLPYAAPEAVRAAFREGERPVLVTTALDAWSVGVLAVELFTGCPALVAFHASKEQVVSQLVGEQPLPWEGTGPVAALLQQGAGRFRRAVLGLLHRDPSKRTLIPSFMRVYAVIMAASSQQDPPLLSATSSTAELPPPQGMSEVVRVPAVPGGTGAAAPSAPSSPQTDRTDSLTFHNAPESPISD